MRNQLSLAAFTLIFGFSVFAHGAVRSTDWNICLIALTVVYVVYWIAGPARGFAPALDGRLQALSVAVLLVTALQLVPLPMGWLRFLSPRRTELLEALRPLGLMPSTAALSIAPALTFAHLTRLFVCLLVFFLARDLAWRFGRRIWTAALPLVLIGGAEAILGLIQIAAGSPEASGTYVNKNHFAALLEMTLPFAALYGIRRSAGRSDEESASLRWAALVCSALAICVSMLLALFYSFSRMATSAVLVSALITGGFTFFIRGFGRSARVTGGAVLVAVPVLVFLAAPTRLVQRFAEPSRAQIPQGEISNENRIAFWRETGRLIADYPIFGCGFGTYASGIQRYRATATLYLLDYAHNDYLQALAEMGIAGFLPFLAFLAISGARLVRLLFAELDATHRYLAMACLAAVTAIALHEFVDFSLYIPANAVCAAWVLGIASAIELRAGYRSNRNVLSEPNRA